MSEQPPRSTLVQRSTPHPGVAVLAFNRPEKRNALSQSLIDEFLSELATVSADHAIKAVILTGGPHFFSAKLAKVQVVDNDGLGVPTHVPAGADINEISRLDFESARGCRYLEDLCNGMAAVRKPVIAAVEGMALGGGFEVALMCDLIFASEITKFGLPEVRIGLIPGAGGTQRLTNAVGKYQAMKMILFGATITGQEALSNGLVTELSPPGSVLDRAIKAAQQLASLSSSAVQLAKEAVCRSDKLGRDDEFERSLYYSAFGTAHKREGVSAFLEKRSPDWDSSGA